MNHSFSNDIAFCGLQENYPEAICPMQNRCHRYLQNQRCHNKYRTVLLVEPHGVTEKGCNMFWDEKAWVEDSLEEYPEEEMYLKEHESIDKRISEQELNWLKSELSRQERLKMTKEEFARCQFRCQDRCFECDHLYTKPLDGQIFYVCEIQNADLLKLGECKYFTPWREEE